MTHPSYLELDRLALGETNDALQRHLADCPQCSAHLAQVREELPRPAWLATLDDPPRPRRLFPALRWAGGLALAGAAAAAAFVVLPLPAEDPPAYVARKGAPSVAIYVHRDGRTALWDGTSSLLPGDRIRLKVAPEGHRWLAVTALSPDGARTPLYEEWIEGDDDHLLPQSWRLDAAPGAERLHVALDDEKVDPTSATWTTTIEIPKEAP